ncbi:MAG: hypothetical protein LQ349_007484, partial [Xanthoria aureola]
VELHDDTQQKANCASCHGLTGLTDPSGWSKALHRRHTEHVAPISALAATAGLEERGTNWDNGAPAKDNTDQGSTGSAKRGTAWDNTPSEDERNALGPKVGQGGKPQPLYGNGWEIGRLTRRFLLPNLQPRADGMDAIDGDKSVSALMGGCINCLVKRLVTRFYPSGSWFAPQAFSKATAADERVEILRRDIAVDGGKPTPLKAKFRPASGCSSCMVRRWVSAPYVSGSGGYTPVAKDPIRGEE